MMAVENVNLMEGNLQHLSVLKCVYSFQVMKLPKFTCSKNTQKSYKNDLHDPDNHNSVITHLDPGILECKFKRASGSITTNKTRGYD